MCQLLRESKRLHFGYVLIVASAIPATIKGLKPWCRVSTTHPRIIDWLEAHGNTPDVFARSVQGLSLEEAMLEASASVSGSNRLESLDSAGGTKKNLKRARKAGLQKSDQIKEDLRKRLVDLISTSTCAYLVPSNWFFGSSTDELGVFLQLRS